MQRFIRKRWIIAGAVLFAVLGMWISVRIALPKTTVVQTQPILKRSLNVEVSATGYLDFGQKSSLSSPATAVVLDVPPRTGEGIEEGDELVKLLVADDQIMVRAPFPGIVLRVGDRMQQGAIIPEGEFLMEIGDNRENIVRSEIDQVDLRNVKVGMAARISSETLSGREFHGFVETVAPAVKDTRGGLKIPVEIRTSQHIPLPVGARVDVRIVSPPRRNVFAIPAEAIAYNSPRPVVYVLRNGKVISVPVRVGVNDGSLVEVDFLGGIDKKDELIVDPSGKFSEGEKVRKGGT